MIGIRKVLSQAAPPTHGAQASAGRLWSCCLPQGKGMVPGYPERAFSVVRLKPNTIGLVQQFDVPV